MEISPFLRPSRRVVYAVALAWAFYFVAANVFINSALLPRIVAPHPERSRISWEKAWTLLPGLVHVRGFSLWSQSKGTEWSLTVDRGRVTINLLSLPFNSLQLVAARAQGIELRVGKADAVLPAKKKTKPGMRIRIFSAHAEDVRSVVLGDLTIEGPLSVRGGLDTRARGPLRVPRTSVTAASAVLKFGENLLATDLEIDTVMSIDRHVPGEHRGEGLLPFVVARIGIDGKVADLSFLQHMLRSTKSVRFGGGSGRIDGDIFLTRGVVEPRSRLVTEEAAYAVDYLGYRAVGTGSIFGFSAADATPDELLRFELRSFSLSYGDDASPYLSGTGLKVSLRGDKGLPVAGEPSPLDLVVDMPDADVPDMTVYNRNLGTSRAVRIVSGTGRVKAHLEVLERSGGARAEASLVAEDLVVELKEKRIVGDLTTTGRITAFDSERTAFDPSGTTVAFRDAGVFVEDGGADTGESSDEETASWWGEVDIPAGRVVFSGQPEVNADFTISAESAEPLFALFAKTQKKADMMDRRLKTEDLAGSGHVVVTQGRVAVTGLDVAGGKATVRAELCMEEGGLHALIHGRYGVLAVAAEIQDGKESLHVTSPKKWFDSHAPNFRCE